MKFLVFIIIFSHFFIQFIHARDSLGPGESIREWEILVSPGEQFVFGFFFQANSNKNRYLGIWIKYSERYNDSTVVWVANPKNPFNDSSGVFTLTKGGSLTVSDGSGSSITIWEGARNSTLRLLDSGNLELREERGRVIWQSFDYPTDTLLPGMKLDLNHCLTSWLTEDDPAPGAYTLGIDPNGTADQLVIWERGVVYWTSGVWNGESFSSMIPKDPFNLNYVRNDDKGNYFSYTMKEGYNNATWVMDADGRIIQRWEMMNDSQLSGTLAYPAAPCDEQLDTTLHSGCMTLEESQCSYGNKFARSTQKYFNYGDYVEAPALAIVDCKISCRRNCSCVAYGSSLDNNDNGTRCRFWTHGSKYRSDEGWRIYVRSGYEGLKKKKKIRVWFIRVAPAAVVLILLLSCCVYCFKRMFKNRVTRETSPETRSEQLLLDVGANKAAAKKISGDGREGKTEGPELQLFSLAAIAAATDDFSIANRLGEGGFGPVFKGKTEDGQEIAVKRLSKSSAQGLEEFKTEIKLIARLQHTNLVRLLGCCITREEKILIYEFMPNNSLDAFLFDPTRRKLLDWVKRIHIIEGISQGLLYLHKFSRLKIIHRDLKASNILLDGEMNPKISDFGMARIFEGNQNQANTKRVVGTYGYMSPEYAMEGIFSVKSDVFSFGVLLLEIISGKKNTSFYYSNLYINLLGYVWELWKDDRCSELIDPLMGDSVHTSNLMRFIHVGLLCVQERAADRPTMSDVVYMLSNEFAPLSTPKQPAFTGERNVREGDSKNPDICSLNNMTITEMQAR